MGAILTLFAIAVVAFFAIVITIKNLLYICPPNEVLIFSGGRRWAGDRLVGYRVIKGGRALRVPLLETVDRMDLTNMVIDVEVHDAYSKGGIPLRIQGVANIKIPGEEPLLCNTLERFLGKSRDEIMQNAKVTLEGNLRGVLAQLTPEQVNEDKVSFEHSLLEEAAHDLNRLGLALDTLKIQNVSDDVGYLNSIGRKRSADVRKNAVIAEAQAQADSEEQKARSAQASQLAKIEADIEIAIKQNERRIADAQTKREAMIAEQQADVLALIAQAGAELEMQKARFEQVRRQLQADVIQPAEAKRAAAEEEAKGDAKKIIEHGAATARAFAEVAQAWKGSGANAREILLLQKFPTLVAELTSTIRGLKVDRLTVIGTSGDGQAPLAARLLALSEQIKAATGVDVPAMLNKDGAKGASKPTRPVDVKLPRS